MSEWTWKSRDGLEMFSRSWEPAGEPSAVICLVNGLGEHIGRYDHVGGAMVKNGFAMVGFDLRGHGKSGGPRGHTPGYQFLMDDISDFIALVKGKFPGKPVFLYGHSLGANLVINFAMREKPVINGVIATGPWLELAFQPPSSKVLLAKVMAGIMPGFTQPNGLDTSALSRVPTVEQDYLNDPLVHNKISARMFLDTYQAGLWALDHAAEFPLPMLLINGTADRICSAEASKRFADANPEKVEGVFLEGWYHEVHNEAESDIVFSFFTKFIQKNI